MEEDLIDGIVKSCVKKVSAYDESDRAALIREVARRLTEEADTIVLDSYFG